MSPNSQVVVAVSPVRVHGQFGDCATGPEEQARKRAGRRRAKVGGAIVSVAVAILAATAMDGAVAQKIEVEETWLRRNCLDRGKAHQPLYGKAFEACLRKKIEGLPPIDPAHRELFGYLYEPERYVTCRMSKGGRNNSGCDLYIMRRKEWPEFWPDGAARPKWPDPPKESVYRPGMKPRQYWEALCKAEAGEFIYRSVKDVDGFLIVRPREAETDLAAEDKYVIEDAYGMNETQFYASIKNPGRFFLTRAQQTYTFVESGGFDERGNVIWIREELDVPAISRFLADPTTMKKYWQQSDISKVIPVLNPKSRYGILWRGIRRENDIALGISGGELLVFDMKTGEHLALRRGFALDPLASRGDRRFRAWIGSQGCPQMAREALTRVKFLFRVLVPRGVLPLKGAR